MIETQPLERAAHLRDTAEQMERLLKKSEHSYAAVLEFFDEFNNPGGLPAEVQHQIKVFRNSLNSELLHDLDIAAEVAGDLVTALTEVSEAESRRLRNGREAS